MRQHNASLEHARATVMLKFGNIIARSQDSPGCAVGMAGPRGMAGPHGAAGSMTGPGCAGGMAGHRGAAGSMTGPGCAGSMAGHRGATSGMADPCCAGRMEDPGCRATCPPSCWVTNSTGYLRAHEYL